MTSYPFAASVPPSPPPQYRGGSFAAAPPSYASLVHGFETDSMLAHRGPLAATPTTADPLRYAAPSSFTCPVDKAFLVPDVYVNLSADGPPVPACAAPFPAAKTQSECLAYNAARDEQPCASRVAKSGSYIDCVDYIWLDAAKGQYGVDVAGKKASGCFTTLIGQCCGTDREPNANVTFCSGPRKPPGQSACHKDRGAPAPAPTPGPGPTPTPGPSPTPTPGPGPTPTPGPGPTPTPGPSPLPSGADRAREAYPAFAWAFPVRQ